MPTEKLGFRVSRSQCREFGVASHVFLLSPHCHDRGLVQRASITCRNSWRGLPPGAGNELPDNNRRMEKSSYSDNFQRGTVQAPAAHVGSKTISLPHALPKLGDRSKAALRFQ